MATVAPPRATPQAADDRSHISRVPYLPGLDGMRALAVMAVMVYHANTSWLPGGFLGVDMFFVISGYLITLLLIAERERNYTISLGHFWMRRARRLLPALFLMLTLVTIWTALFERNALGQLRASSTSRTGTRSGSASGTPRRVTLPRCATCGAWLLRSSSTCSGRW